MKRKVEDIQRVTSLRKKFPHLKGITLSTEIVRFFEEYMVYTDGTHEISDFFRDWISFLRNHNLNGMDLNWLRFDER